MGERDASWVAWDDTRSLFAGWIGVCSELKDGRLVLLGMKGCAFGMLGSSWGPRSMSYAGVWLRQERLLYDYFTRTGDA